MRTAFKALTLCTLLAIYSCGGPYILTRSAAKSLIEDSEDFKRGTAFYFEMGDVAVFSNPAGQNLIKRYQNLGFVKPRGTGYEATIGDGQITVTGILKDGNRATVEFLWMFRSVNELGSALLSEPRVAYDGHLNEHVEEFAGKDRDLEPRENMEPWKGTAHLLDYDDGWRLKNIDWNDRWRRFAPPR
jgi:hypothetical protein